MAGKLTFALIAIMAVAGIALVSFAGASSEAIPDVPVATSVIKDPTAVPPPITRQDAQRVEVHLAVREAIADIAPGKRYLTWAYGSVAANGTVHATVPGPMIRVRQGDTVAIHFTNLADNVEPHDIDFHAVVGPGGGGAVLEAKPGQTKTLTFKANHAGAFIYHCAGEGMPWEHVAHGMYGLIQVDPPGGPAPGFDEFYVGQNEWYLAPEAEHVSGHGSLTAYNLDEDKATAEQPDLITFNGHTKALQLGTGHRSTMEVQRGAKVRVFFVNGGPNLTSSFHVMGETFDSFYAGDPRDATHGDGTVAVPPGSAMVAEFATPVPGDYQLVDHALWRVPRGAEGILTVEPRCHDAGTCSWPRNLYSPPATKMGHGASALK